MNLSEQSRWFAEKVQPHELLLRAWLQSRFPADFDFDDIVQDAFLRVLQAHERENLRSPRAFLFKTARNLALDRLRHSRVAQTEALVESDALYVLEEGMGVPEIVARNQELELLTEAIQTLPKRCRQVFTLRKVYDLSQKEIARKLGISEHTVSAQMTIALRKCFEFMARSGRRSKGPQ